MRFLVPHRAASVLLEHTPTYFGGEPVILVKSPESILVENSLFCFSWWFERSQEYKISPGKSVRPLPLQTTENSFISLLIGRIRVIFKT